MRRLPIPTNECQLCGKKARTSFYQSHSHKRTKRLVKPNLLSYKGNIYCASCWRTLKRFNQKTGS